MDGHTRLTYKLSHPFAFTLTRAFQSSRPLEDTGAMHAGKNDDTNMQPSNLGLLTKTHLHLHYDEAIGLFQA